MKKNSAYKSILGPFSSGKIAGRISVPHCTTELRKRGKEGESAALLSTFSYEQRLRKLTQVWTNLCPLKLGGHLSHGWVDPEAREETRFAQLARRLSISAQAKGVFVSVGGVICLPPSLHSVWLFPAAHSRQWLPDLCSWARWLVACRVKLASSLIPGSNRQYLTAPTWDSTWFS